MNLHRNQVTFVKVGSFSIEKFHRLNVTDDFPLFYTDRKAAVGDTVTTLMQQKIAEKQAEAERELMAGTDEKSLKVQ